MTALGYVESTLESADLLAFRSSGRRLRPLLPASRPYGIDSGDIAEGTLVLDLFDRASGEEVWHGQVTGRVLPGIVDSDRLNNAVRSLVSEVPQAIAAPAPSVELAPDGV